VEKWIPRRQEKARNKSKNMNLRVWERSISDKGRKKGCIWGGKGGGGKLREILVNSGKVKVKMFKKQYLRSQQGKKADRLGGEAKHD